MKNTPSPILITGCARSGTSLIAGIINMCGAFGGNMSGPNRNNKKGMFENAYIRNNLVKPYLREIGKDPLGQFPLPDISNLPIPKDWREKVLRIIYDDGYRNGPWMYKGAKMCLQWPVWDFAFPDAKWVIVRRRTGDIINSCIKTGFMRAYNKSHVLKQIKVTNEYDGWRWWVNQHEQRFIEMYENKLNCKMVWPERMVYEDYDQIKELIQWLGLQWTDKIYEFIEPRLWKSKKQMIKQQ